MSDAELSLNAFGAAGISSNEVMARLAWLRDVVAPRLDRFMGYYRNPTTELAAVLPCSPSARFSVRPFRQYQELGLPARITGFRRGASGECAATGPIEQHRKEVVIENDIGWRINTQVDFAVGKMPVINSAAADAGERERLTAVIHSIVAAAGGIGFLQELVLKGAIGGSAWIQLRPTRELLRHLARRAAARMVAGRGEREKVRSGGETSDACSGTGTDLPDQDNASAAGEAAIDREKVDVARWLAMEIVDAGRVCPLPHAGDSAACSHAEPALVAVLHERQPEAGGGGNGAGLMERLRAWLGRPMALAVSPREFSFDLFGAGHWQRYEGGVLVEEGPNLLGVLPFVRYENQADPAAGSVVGPVGSGAIDTGFSDVEPLIAMQDELNTRLSDRAHRVTMTSFQMYLGKGIEDFTKRMVGPGQMWSTDNAEASIEAFGGDAATPSEDSHINEVRQALDKISGVPQVAAGVFRVKLGNLTSGVALRLTLIALLARTERKRGAVEAAVGELVRRVLGILDEAGIVKSAAEDRGIEITWDSAVPESEMDRLQEAQAKVALGIPREAVLREMGYGDLIRPEEGEGAAGTSEALPAEAAAMT